MNSPVPSLMKHYNTEDVFMSKTADGASLLARLVTGLLNLGMAESNKNTLRDQLQDNDQRYEAGRELELAKMRQITDPLKGETSGTEPGMTRLASVAAAAGADLARKEAGIGDFATAAKGLLTGGMGLKTNLALGAAGLGTAYLGSKALNKGTRELARTSGGPATYGMPNRGVGYQLPFGVNQYGQPQVGTPLG